MPRGQRRAVAGARHEAIEIDGHADAAGGNRAAEASHERGPAGEKRGQSAEGLAQIDVFAARLRLPRGQFRVGEGARERERAAERPHAEDRDTARQQGGDEARRREDADADDVGDDNGRRIKGSEAAIKRRACRGDHRVSR